MDRNSQDNETVAFEPETTKMISHRIGRKILLGGLLLVILIAGGSQSSSELSGVVRNRSFKVVVGANSTQKDFIIDW